MFTTTLVVGLLPIFVVAQYGDPNPSPTSSSPVVVPSAPANTDGQFNVDVAFQGQFIFNPSNLTAPNGTKVTFWFPNTGIDHSVTQSSFGAPCTYLAATANTSAGFDSGLQSAKTFTITILDDTKPIWFHCKQELHCGMGMVGSINAPTTGNTFDAYLAAAKKIGNSEVKETGGPVTGGVNGVASALPASSTGGTNNNGANSFYDPPLAFLVCAVYMVLSMV